MTPTDSSSRLGCEFDRFLFEPIGEDRNGMPVSVVSALARMDLDAWQEAAALAALPAETAAEKLAALLRALPDQSVMQTNRAMLVTRLIALLPPPASSNAQAQLTPTGAAAAAISPTGVSTIFFALYLIALLAAQSVIARRELQTQGDPALQPTSRPIASRTSPASPVE